MKIAICGFGTVGSGVYECLKQSNHEVVRVFNLYSEYLHNLLGDKLTCNLDDIINDQEIECVVETIGGATISYEIAKRTLESKKHFVSANKELLANHFNELIKLAKANGVKCLFEASVGGGVPIIRSLSDITKRDTILSIYGILNGTTNFVLSKCQKKGYEIKEAIKLAQRSGFAESDPSSDLMGKDMQRKIAILSMLVTNSTIYPDLIPSIGVENLTDSQLKLINDEGYVLKFVCEAKFENNVATIQINPIVFRKNTNFIENVNGTTNVVYLNCKYNGPLMFCGPGAGMLPTAQSIVSDINSLNDNLYYYYDNSCSVIQSKEISLTDYYVINNNNESKIIKTNDINLLKSYAFSARVMKG